MVSPPSVEDAVPWSCPPCQERQAALQFGTDRPSDPAVMSMVDSNRDTSVGNISTAAFSDPA